MDALDNDKFLITDELATVEIGDTKQPDFYPQAKIIQWQNEVNFSIRYAADITNSTVGVDAQGRVVWTGADGTEVHLYELPHPGLELEVIYKVKPASNVVDFTLQHKELDFFYQPELTQEEYDRGARRPDDVVGSYAVYHASKVDNQYKTGKAFHIFRPKAVDAAGMECWCDLGINAEVSILTVTVPQVFLDEAVYPVTVDPTFGYTTAGASSQYLSDQDSGLFQAVNYFASAPASVSIDSLSVYCNPSSAGVNGKPVIWGGGSLPQAIITNGAGASTAMANGAGWKTLPYATKPSVASGTSYRMGFIGGTDGVLAYYDSGSAPDAANFNYGGLNFATPPSWPNASNSNLGRFSVYATYSTGSLIMRLCIEEMTA